MTIIYETLDEQKPKNNFTTSFVFERIDPRKREIAYKKCLDIVSNFLLSKIAYVSLVILNIIVIDTKVKRYLGAWDILVNKDKLTLPEGTRSSYREEKDGHLYFICKIDIDSNDILKSLEVMDKHRSSMLLLGNIKIDDSIMVDFFNSTEHLFSENAGSWFPLATQITKRDLVGVRLFGMFNDLENGVVVYEPILFSKLHKDWSLR